MSVSKMSRVEIWAYSSDAVRLSRRLVRLKCLDVDTAPLTEGVTSRYDSTADIRESEKRCAVYDRVIETLSRYDGSKKKKKKKGQPVKADTAEFVKSGRMKKAEETVDEVLRLLSERERIDNELVQMADSKTALSPWIDLDVPLNLKSTARTDVVTGTFPVSVGYAEMEDAAQGADFASVNVSKSSDSGYWMIVSPSAGTEGLLRKFARLGFTRIDLSGVPGTAAEAYGACEKEETSLEREGLTVTDRLIELAADLDDVKILWDITRTAGIEAELRRRMAATDDCVLVEGWVPQKNLEKVERVLASFPCAYELRDPEEGEDVPVTLENNFFAKNFEWVISMYSLPAYGTYDPSFIMGICYVILFSLMFADVGYGLLLALGGFLLPPILHLKEGTKRAFYMFAFCGLGSIVTGVLFGGYFGDLPIALMKAFNPGADIPSTLALIVDPVADPMTFMVIGLAAGFLHLVTAQAVKFAIVWKKSKFDAICDYAFYWIIYAGIIILVAVDQKIGMIVTAVGAVLVVLTAGRKEKNIFMRLPKGFLGLYGLVNFGSDIISYSRILAIALSGAVLASVFNILATMSSATVFRIIGMPLILIIGHVLNLALGARSAFVHTSRLQYVEFFGKFYEDGGRPYLPFEPSGRFIIEE